MRRLALIPISLLLLAHDPSLEPFRGSFAASSNQLPDIKQSTIEKIIERDFKLSDPNYIVTRSVYANRLKALTTQLIALQKQGKDMACSDQMLVEARWLLEHTTDWARLDAQLAKLARSLQATTGISQISSPVRTAPGGRATRGGF